MLLIQAFIFLLYSKRFCEESLSIQNFRPSRNNSVQYSRCHEQTRILLTSKRKRTNYSYNKQHENGQLIIFIINSVSDPQVSRRVHLNVLNQGTQYCRNCYDSFLSPHSKIKGHFLDDLFLRLRPEFTSFILSYLNLVILVS